MEAQYVARMDGSKSDSTTHKVRDGWSYDRITEARTGCGIKGPFSIEHYGSGRLITVTCRRLGCRGEE